MITTFILIFTLSIFSIYSIRIVLTGYYYGFIMLFISILSIYLVLNPDIAGLLANYFGVGRGADLLLYLSFATGLILFLRIQIEIRSLRKSITELARYIALNSNSK
jgi:hypothetical protein